MSAYGAAQLAAAFRTVRKNTIQVANDIPEAKYDYMAAPGVKSVRALLTHLAIAPAMYEDMHKVNRITTLQGYDFGAMMGKNAAEEAKPRSKAEIVALLEANGESFANWLGSLSDAFLAETFTDPMGANPRSRLEHLLSPKEHEMHHRGQLMLIERLIGITPHLTRQMQERMAARAPQPAARA